MKKVRGYVFSRELDDSHVPQHVQNIIIRDYCSKHKLQYLLSATEYSMANSYKILDSVINKINNIDGVVFYNFFQLPHSFTKREKIFKKFVQNKKTLHFAVENISFNSVKDFKELERLLKLQNAINQNKQKLKIKNLRKSIK
jgi:sporadic carbohydrate cluster protein (TIGR04323 family)